MTNKENAVNDELVNLEEQKAEAIERFDREIAAAVAKKFQKGSKVGWKAPNGGIKEVTVVSVDEHRVTVELSSGKTLERVYSSFKDL